MFLQIVFIAICTIIGGGFLYFCYRRIKQQKIIEGGIPNYKLRMFWITICTIVGGFLGLIVNGLSGLLLQSETKTDITSQPTTGANTENTGNTQGIFVGSGAILPGGVEETGVIESRTTIREKLKYVPVTEKRGADTSD